MKITVITVAFNSAATLGATLKSVASQKKAEVEHILIDGASSDSTSCVVKKDGNHLAKYISEPDTGIYAAMNKGIALATGDVVGFLNSDDMFSGPDSLEKIGKAFDGPDIDAVYGDIVMVDPFQTNVIRRYWRPGPHFTGACAKGWMAPHPTFYVRKSILVSAGGFNQKYRIQADFDLELRLFECLKIRSKYVPDTLVRMRMGGLTTGSPLNVIRGNLEAAHSVKQHGYRGGVGFVASKIMSRFRQYWMRPQIVK